MGARARDRSASGRVVTSLDGAAPSARWAHAGWAASAHPPSRPPWSRGEGGRGEQRNPRSCREAPRAPLLVLGPPSSGSPGATPFQGSAVVPQTHV